MHGLFTELIEEPNGHEVEIPVHEAVDTELRCSELAFTVLHHFLADLSEPRVLGEIRDVTVHLGEDLDVLHHLLAVRFEPAVHIVQMDARHPPGCSIKELGGQVLGQGVVIAFLLPS